MSEQKNPAKQQDKHISRRDFLGGAAAAASAFTIVPRHVLGGPGYIPPSEKLNIAAVGIGGMGKNNLSQVKSENIVALCDVDDGFAAPVYDKYPKAKRYKDFRKMFEKQKNIDAVIVATPDHTHAIVAMMAIKAGKHVYVQKPLTHTVYEARKLTEAAREAKVMTQMGNQGRSGEGVRLVCEWIWDGAIGPVHEVHAWTNRPTWPQGIDRPEGEDPIPPGLDWDLWLGPAPYRPYIGFRFPFGRPEFKQYRNVYHPHDWRGFWDFGGGAIGDLFCHIVDSAFWSLRLKYPTAVEASHSSYMDGMLGKPETKDTYPVASIIRFEFPARGDMPPVKLIWHDGGLKPPRPAELEPGRTVQRGMSIIFIGEKGTLVAGETGDSPRLIPESKMRAYKLPRKTIPRVGQSEGGNKGHEMDWVRACKDGKPACSNFDESGPLTEADLLGNVALRMAEQKLEWDGENMKFTNNAEANKYLHKEYRKGWTLDV
ncbi:MAG: Gfo/Idh/MocA family oxidoreductase [Dehalococcoidales bacterium]